MKTGFFLANISSGGGFYQTVNFALSLNKLAKDKDITFITDNQKIKKILEQNDIPILFFKNSLLNNFIFRILNIDFIKKLFNKLSIKNPLEKFLSANKIDFLIFNSPSIYTLYSEKINYVCSIWNSEIKTFNHFNEFLIGNYNYQNNIINSIAKYAFKIVVFTERNRKDLINYYNCVQNKIVTQNLIPLFPKIFEKNKITVNYDDIYQKLELDASKKWIFYPSEFIPHKNHIYILDTLNFLNDEKYKNINFVFTGSDGGNLSYIKKMIKLNNLDNRVKIFNYLENNQIISLYKNCSAVVMPTYVGRSSLPLLESLYFNKKIFYTKDILDDDLKKYVTEVDLNEPEDLAEKLKSFYESPDEINTKQIYESICSEENLLINYKKIIDEFEYIRKRWV